MPAALCSAVLPASDWRGLSLDSHATLHSPGVCVRSVCARRSSWKGMRDGGLAEMRPLPGLPRVITVQRFVLSRPIQIRTCGTHLPPLPRLFSARKLDFNVCAFRCQEMAIISLSSQPHLVASSALSGKCRIGTAGVPRPADEVTTEHWLPRDFRTWYVHRRVPSEPTKSTNPRGGYNSVHLPHSLGTTKAI